MLAVSAPGLGALAKGGGWAEVIRPHLSSISFLFSFYFFKSIFLLKEGKKEERERECMGACMSWEGAGKRNARLDPGP